MLCRSLASAVRLCLALLAVSSCSVRQWRPRTGRSGAGRRVTACLPSRVFRRHGARRRTSPGEPRSRDLAPRRRSCGATGCLSRRRSAAPPWPMASRIPGSPATTAHWPSTSGRLAEIARPQPEPGARCGSSSRRSGDPTASGSGSIEPKRPGGCQSCTRSTTSRPRRRSPTASVSTPGSATDRSWHSTWTAASPGHAISAPSTRRSRPAGGTAAHPRCTAISSSCSATTNPTPICWRSTRGRGSSGGRRTAGTRGSRIARRWWCVVRKATSCSSTRPSESTSTIRQPGRCCGTPARHDRRPFPRPSFTTD